MPENETNYFTDDLGTLLTDARKCDERRVSELADAEQVIEAFRSLDGSGPWTGLDRSKVADRILEIASNSRCITQGHLNLCGPAALICMWAGRDPVAFANFATELYNSGSSAIGSMAIEPSANLISQDFSGIAGATGTEGTDWMILSAIRNTDQPFWQPEWVGDADQTAAGLTRPEELAEWLRATGIYGNVRDEGNWVSPAGIPHAQSLEHVEGRDIALLIHNNLLNTALNQKLDDSLLLSQFPNHYVVSLSGITPAAMDEDSNPPRFRTGDLLLSVWSNGTNNLDLAVPQEEFVKDYYGAIIADLA